MRPPPDVEPFDHTKLIAEIGTELRRRRAARRWKIVLAGTLVAVWLGTMIVPLSGQQMRGETIEGRRIHVVDGDTVDLPTGERIRLYAIDTPERGCNGFRQARNRLIELLDGTVTILRGDDTGRQKDRHGRTLGSLVTRRGDVAETLIREGLGTRWPERARC